jgi:two-component system, LuxR family, response regulator FixJ
MGPANRSAGIPPGNAAGSGSLPVCVIDDDPAVRDSACLLLTIHGYEAIGHPSGAALLADEKRHGFGCLILDQHMPGMTGLEALAALRHEGDAVPAILITGRLSVDVSASAQTLGVVAILEKPFDGTRLIDIVRDQAGRYP